MDTEKKYVFSLDMVQHKVQYSSSPYTVVYSSSTTKPTVSPGAPGGPLKPGGPFLVELQKESTTEEEKRER